MRVMSMENVRKMKQQTHTKIKINKLINMKRRLKAFQLNCRANGIKLKALSDNANN